MNVKYITDANFQVQLVRWMNQNWKRVHRKRIYICQIKNGGLIVGLE